MQMLTCIRQVDLPHQCYKLSLITATNGFNSKSKKTTCSNKWKKNEDRYLMKKSVLEKPQQVIGKMNRVQKMLDKFQQVLNKTHRVQKILDKFQEVMDKINRTLEVQEKLQQVVGKAK